MWIILSSTNVHEELCTWCHPSSYNEFYIRAHEYVNAALVRPFLSLEMGEKNRSMCGKFTIKFIRNMFNKHCLMMWIIRFWAPNENETIYIYMYMNKCEQDEKCPARCSSWWLEFSKVLFDSFGFIVSSILYPMIWFKTKRKENDLM